MLLCARPRALSSCSLRDACASHVHGGNPWLRKVPRVSTSHLAPAPATAAAAGRLAAGALSQSAACARHGDGDTESVR